MDVPEKKRHVNVKTIEERLEHPMFIFIFIFFLLFIFCIVNSKPYVVGTFYEC